MSLTVLATGGAGYIGSHVVAELLASGARVVILDDFSNPARPWSTRSARWASGRSSWSRATSVTAAGSTRSSSGSSRRGDPPRRAEGGGRIDAKPLRYYDVNVGGAVALFEAMLRHGVRRLVFSSSATVYGAPRSNPIAEDGAARRAQSLWADQADDRAGHRRPRRRRARFRRDLAALLQSGRRAPVGADRRASERGAEQSVPLHRPDRGRGAREGPGLRRRLSDAGRHRHPRLYPRRRPGAGASGGGRPPAVGCGARGRNLAINLGCGRGYSVLECLAPSRGRAAARCPSRSSGAGRRRRGVRGRPGPGGASSSAGGRSGGSTRCAGHWAFQSRLAMPG